MMTTPSSSSVSEPAELSAAVCISMDGQYQDVVEMVPSSSAFRSSSSASASGSDKDINEDKDIDEESGPGLVKKSTKDTSTDEDSLQDPEGGSDDDSDDDDEDDSFDETESERQRRLELEPYLLNHAYHLPGNHYWHQDWWQYMTNNHPVFGICLHHRYHPLSAKVRVLTLFGSMLFGLALTNIIYLAFVFTDQDDAFDASFYHFETNLTKTGWNEQLDETVSSVSVTTGNLVLWTIGALIHGLYDNTIWSLAVCDYCQVNAALARNGRRLSQAQIDRRMKWNRTTGSVLVMLSVILITAVCSFAVLLRAAIDADQDGGEKTTIFSHFSNDTNSTTSLNVDAVMMMDDDLFNSTNMTTTLTSSSTPMPISMLEQVARTVMPTPIAATDMSSSSSSSPNVWESHIQVQNQLENVYYNYNQQDFADYKFVVSYFVELLLSYLIYYPIAGTVLFSGLLSCGKWQVTGGRPYELRQIALQSEREMRQQEDEDVEGGVEVEWKDNDNNLDGTDLKPTDGGSTVEGTNTSNDEEDPEEPSSSGDGANEGIHHQVNDASNAPGTEEQSANREDASDGASDDEEQGFAPLPPPVVLGD